MMPFFFGRNWDSLPKSELNMMHFQIHRAYGTFKKFGKYEDRKGHNWNKGNFHNQHKLIEQVMKGKGMNHHHVDDLDMSSIGQNELLFNELNVDDELAPVQFGKCLYKLVLENNKYRLLENEEIVLAIDNVFLSQVISSFMKVVNAGHISEPWNDVAKRCGMFKSLFSYYLMQLADDETWDDIEDSFIMLNDWGNYDETLKRHESKPLELKLGQSFNLLKTNLEYDKGVVFNFDALANLVNDYPVSVEKVHNGIFVQLHKNGDEVKIFNDNGADITHRLPSFVEEVKGRGWPTQVILTSLVEMWIGDKCQPYEVVSEFLQSVDDLFTGEDKQLVMNVHDVVWLTTDLHNSSYEDRRANLNNLPVAQSTDKVPKLGTFNKVPIHICNDESDLIRATKSVLKNSEDVIIKPLNSKYELSGISNSWCEYRSSEFYIAVALKKMETRTDDMFDYYLGMLPHSKFNASEDDIIEVDNEKYVYVGKSMSTKMDIPLGVPLKVTAESVKLYQNRMRLYVPIILEQCELESVMNINVATKVASDVGLLDVKKSELSWPEEKIVEGVVQFHSGETVHNDFRVSVGNVLEGWSIFSLPAEVIKEGIKNMTEFKKIIRHTKWKWPRSDLHVRSTPKLTQPKEWLTAQGNLTGTTKENIGHMVIVDKPKVEFGARKTWFYEYFYNGKLFKGRLLFRFIPKVGENQQGYWNTWVAKNNTPYVLSLEAQKENWIPPQGISALPKSMRSKVPLEYRYWVHSSRTRRIEIRNSLRKARQIMFRILRKLDDHIFLLEKDGENYIGESQLELSGAVSLADFGEVTKVDMKSQKFYLMRHWWKGQKVGVIEHYDLIIPNDTQIVLGSNPFDGEVESQIRKPYANNFWLKAKKNAELIEPKTPGNPTTDMPAWVELVDSGEVFIVENGESLKQYNFYGDKLKGTFMLERGDYNVNLWKFNKLEMGEEVRKMELSEGESVVRHVVFSTIDNFELEGDDVAIVEGTALTYGVWNGDFYPPEVLDDRPQRIMDVPVGVGPHKDRKNYGNVVDFSYDMSTHRLRTKAKIKGKEQVDLVKSGKLGGQSVELTVWADDTRRMIKKIVSYDRLSIVENPACVVCNVDNIKT